MNKSDSPRLPLLKRLDGDPTFDEPWQARIMGIVSELTRGDTPIPRKFWSDALGKSLRQHDTTSGRDEAADYYESVMQLLENTLAERDILSGDEIAERVKLWKAAYINTPHGKPALLSAAETAQASTEEKGNDTNH